ncbi:hypothetical protein ASE96_16350 [Arthrobacter sp. Leaf69]|nr:hypothetical protein ASE96_16350 [Arthrobacter sp. Leaf69]
MGDEPASCVVRFELLDAQQTGPATLEYEYDFGDAWTHLFEVMGPAELPAPCAGSAAPTGARWRMPAGRPVMRAS